MIKKRILIVANGLSNSGGIGNALQKMIRMMYQLDNELELDLMLLDYESRHYVDDLPCNIIEAEYCYSLNISLIQLIKKVLKRKMPLSFLIHRLLYKLHYSLPLINDIANSIESIHKQYELAIAYNCIPNAITTYVANRVIANYKVAWAHISIFQKNRKYYGKHSTLWINGLKKYSKVLDKFNMIYAVSNDVKESILHEINANLPVEVFHNFRDKEYIVKKSYECIDHNINNGEIKLLTVGRLSKEKGIDRLLLVAKKMKRSNINYKWYLLGELQEEQYVKSYIVKHNLFENIKLLGVVSNPYPYFKMCDIYVHSSNVEGYSSAIEEARMLGKPIVSTRVAGVNEQIRNGINGYITDNNANNLFKCIKYLIDNPTISQKFITFNNNTNYDNTDSTNKLKKMINTSCLCVSCGVKI